MISLIKIANIKAAWQMALPILGHIFDLDETLVHSGLDFDQMRLDLGFPEGVGILEYLSEHVPMDQQARCHKIIHEHELAGARRAEPIDGAVEYVEKVLAQDLPVAIVTRNSKEVAQMTVKACHIPIKTLMSRDCAKPKPSPEALLKIASQWKLEPTRCIYYGDFVMDLKAAKNADMYSALIANQRNPHIRDQADLVVESYRHLELPLIMP